MEIHLPAQQRRDRRKLYERCKKKIAKTLKVQEKEICFTSGGTESNNLAMVWQRQTSEAENM